MQVPLIPSSRPDEAGICDALTQLRGKKLSMSSANSHCTKLQCKYNLSQVVHVDSKNFDSSKKLNDEIAICDRIGPYFGANIATIGIEVANHSRLLQQVSESKLCNTFSDIAVPISATDGEGHPVGRFQY